MDQAARRNRVLTPSWTRRGFLQRAAAGAALAAGGKAVAAPAPAPKVETILVVGAGLAGLVAAYRLREAGKRVILIEARAEPGGRVRTLRNYFDDGLYGELGAARVAETHEYVFHWLSDLGLGLTPFAGPGSQIQVVNGTRFRADDEAARERFAPQLHANERKLSSQQLLLKYIEGVPEDLGSPDIDFSNPRWQPFDRVTWPDWLASRGASKAAIQLITLGGDSSQFSALFLLQQIMLHKDSHQYMKIEGGMDRLPRAIAMRLGATIRYGCELIRLDRSGSGVSATCKLNGAGTEKIAADRAVLAIPFSTLKRVQVDPPFSPAKTQTITGLTYHAATRFILQTKTRFWQAQGLTGGARTDGPADIWDMSQGQKGTRGLISLTTGNDSIELKLAPMDGNARRAFGAGLAKAAFPELDQELQKAFVHRWTGEPFARGAYTIFRPGQMTAWAKVLGRPEGKVHFAGEHITPWNGWMEGAIWSGERVAQEILQQGILQH